MIQLTVIQQDDIDAYFSQISFRVALHLIGAYNLEDKTQNDYGTNLFATDQNKYVFVCNASLSKTDYLLVDDMPIRYADFAIVNTKAKSRFGVDLDIINITAMKHPSQDNYYDCQIPTGIGLMPVFKYQGLTYNEQKYIRWLLAYMTLKGVHYLIMLNYNLKKQIHRLILIDLIFCLLCINKNSIS